MLSFDQWFQLANVLALGGWVLLAASLFLGEAKSTVARLRTWGGRAVPVALSVGYAVALATSWGSAPGGGFSSLSGVATLFSSRGVLLAGWVHYLAFDLLVGRAILDDGVARGVARVTLLMPMALTFMFGPVGLLCYLMMRRGVSRKVEA